MKNQDTYDLIIGLGKSGASMARFLHARGRQVVVTDIDPSKASEAERLDAMGINTQIGFHDQTTFDRADRMIPSPGIPLTVPFIQKAMQKAVPIASELDIFYQHNTLPVIAITGTNGKTTTTTLLGEMLSASGHAPFVCGNIGTPLVDLFMDNRTYTVVVAEVSSFQMDISTRFRPDVGILLNITEDHLDRYDNLAVYEDAKWRLFAYQTRHDTAVINRTIADFPSRSKQLSGRLLTFSSNPKNMPECQAEVNADHIDVCIDQQTWKIETSRFKGLPGIHNHENIAAAFLAGLAINADAASMEQAIAQFKNLPHRIEYVDTIRGIHFYNDSKATNVDAVSRAIQSFKQKIILILGGREKGTDFTELFTDVSNSAKAIVAIGETKEIIKDMFITICPTMVASSMEQAVQTAFSTADTGDIVLLSPACASFDMYDNYAQRGLDFIHQVKRLKDQ
jgi:UDP-N-acetylmuramoylalanine--D-glutamate ligase